MRAVSTASGPPSPAGEGLFEGFTLNAEMRARRERRGFADGSLLMRKRARQNEVLRRIYAFNIVTLNAEMQAVQGARVFSMGVYKCVHEREKRSATLKCDAYTRLNDSFDEAILLIGK